MSEPLVDGAVVVDTDEWNALVAAGAHIEVVSDTPLECVWHTALIDLAERGFVFPFRVLNTEQPSRAYGMFVANDAGHANVCSVHPDNRGALAWEIGTCLASGDPEAHHFYQWVRTDCRVRW